MGNFRKIGILQKNQKNGRIKKWESLKQNYTNLAKL